MGRRIPNDSPRGPAAAPPATAPTSDAATVMPSYEPPSLMLCHMPLRLTSWLTSAPSSWERSRQRAAEEGPPQPCCRSPSCPNLLQPVSTSACGPLSTWPLSARRSSAMPSSVGGAPEAVSGSWSSGGTAGKLGSHSPPPSDLLSDATACSRGCRCTVEDCLMQVAGCTSWPAPASGPLRGCLSGVPSAGQGTLSMSSRSSRPPPALRTLLEKSRCPTTWCSANRVLGETSEKYTLPRQPAFVAQKVHHYF